MILYIFAIHLKHVIILLATMFTLFPLRGNEDHIRSCPVHAVYSTPSVSAWQPQSSLGHIHVLAGTMSRAGKLLMCDRHSLKPINPSPSYLNLGLIWRVIVSRQVKPCAFLLAFYQAPAQRDLRAIHSGGGKKNDRHLFKHKGHPKMGNNLFMQWKNYTAETRGSDSSWWGACAQNFD